MSLREQPPREGPGSSIGAWTSYALGLGVEVEASDGRADIIAKVDAAEPLAGVTVVLDDDTTAIVEPVEDGLVRLDLTRRPDPTPAAEETVVQAPSAETVAPGEQRTYYSPYPKLIGQAGSHRAASSSGPAVRAPELGEGRAPFQFSEMDLEVVTPGPKRPPFDGRPFVARGKYVTSDPVEIAFLERVPEAVRVA